MVIVAVFVQFVKAHRFYVNNFYGVDSGGQQSQVHRWTGILHFNSFNQSQWFPHEKVKIGDKTLTKTNAKNSKATLINPEQIKATTSVAVPLHPSRLPPSLGHHLSSCLSVVVVDSLASVSLWRGLRLSLKMEKKKWPRHPSVVGCCINIMETVNAIC